MEEIWKDIKGFEGYYQISSYGNVRSLDRFHEAKYLRNQPTIIYKGCLLKPYIGKDGYYLINLKKAGKSKTFSIHRLVALHFIENPLNKKCVDHINTNRVDNRVCNLRWVSFKENQNNPLTRSHLSAAKLGDKHPQFGKRQAKEYIEKRVEKLRYSSCCKPVLQLSLNDEIIKEYHSLSEAKRHIGTSPWKAVVYGKLCKGYKWKYK